MKHTVCGRRAGWSFGHTAARLWKVCFLVFLLCSSWKLNAASPLLWVVCVVAKIKWGLHTALLSVPSLMVFFSSILLDSSFVSMWWKLCCWPRLGSAETTIKRVYYGFFSNLGGVKQSSALLSTHILADFYLETRQPIAIELKTSQKLAR